MLKYCCEIFARVFWDIYIQHLRLNRLKTIRNHRELYEGLSQIFFHTFYTHIRLFDYNLNHIKKHHYFDCTYMEIALHFWR